VSEPLAPAGAPDARERVLVIAPTPFFADRGCHVRIYEEITLLQDLGYRVEVCTYHHGRDVPGIRTRRTPRIPWYRKLGPGPSWHKLYVDLLLLWASARAIRELRPAMVHAHLHEGALLAAILTKMFRVPCVADLQGSLTRELADYRFAGKNRVVYRLMEAVERWVNRSMDQIVVSSEAMRDDLVTRFDVSASRITVVPDGVGRGFFEEAEPFDRARWGIPGNHRIVVFLGVLTELQGIEILMEAIPRVLGALEDVTFVVIGFPNERHFARRMERRGFGDRAVFTGRLDYLSVSKALAMADLAVSPKMSETEGNGKLFNYMACGLPTVVFDGAVNRGILGEHGIYVESRTADAFAEAIIRALEGGAGVRALGGALRQRAMESASWERNRSVIQKVYGRAHAAR
jgi:glycosyltransferase involved in cell wall biosynthesis